MTGIYARQSVDRPDSISVEQQTEYCQYETHGDNFRVYADRGFSGKNTLRPQFTAMMSDIENGLIDTVIVYRLDRISRSVLDFAVMMEKFDRFNVKFISATEKFDTSSPVGRAMLSICIVFAQLERETIQMRISDAYFSRSRKGLYMGGKLPFGFRRTPTVINGINTSMYVHEPDEAEQIRIIFGMYSLPDTSLGNIACYLNENGFRKNGRMWERSRIRDIIVNPAYVRADSEVYGFFIEKGCNVINPPEDFIGINGCYRYSSEKSVYDIVVAPHEGIVDSGIWLKCNRMLTDKKNVHTVHKTHNTWLAGKIKCGKCGYALLAKEFRNHRNRYLMCSQRLSNRSCDISGTIYTDITEQAVYNEIYRKLSAYGTDVNAEIWKTVSPEDKCRIADILISRIYIVPEKITIIWKI